MIPCHELGSILCMRAHEGLICNNLKIPKQSSRGTPMRCRAACARLATPSTERTGMSAAAKLQGPTCTTSSSLQPSCSSCCPSSQSWHGRSCGLAGSPSRIAGSPSLVLQVQAAASQGLPVLWSCFVSQKLLQMPQAALELLVASILHAVQTFNIELGHV